MTRLEDLMRRNEQLAPALERENLRLEHWMSSIGERVQSLKEEQARYHDALKLYNLRLQELTQVRREISAERGRLAAERSDARLRQMNPQARTEFF
jgi:hypothetical protein